MTKIGIYLPDDIVASTAFAGAALVLVFMLWRTARLLVADWVGELTCHETWSAVAVVADGAALFVTHPRSEQRYGLGPADMALQARLGAHWREVSSRLIEPIGEIEHGYDPSPESERSGRALVAIAPALPSTQDDEETCNGHAEHGLMPLTPRMPDPDGWSFVHWRQHRLHVVASAIGACGLHCRSDALSTPAPTTAGGTLARGSA